MICERCRGKGRIHIIAPSTSDRYDLMTTVPCPECNGCGQASCCQGHEAQPEPDGVGE